MEGRTDFSHGDPGNIRVCNPNFFREVLARLPLADAVFHLLGYALNEKFLSDCFEKYRGSYCSGRPALSKP